MWLSVFVPFVACVFVSFVADRQLPSRITRHDSMSKDTSPIVIRVWSRRLAANLTNASGINEKSLEREHANLNGTTMPDGTRHP